MDSSELRDFRQFLKYQIRNEDNSSLMKLFSLLRTYHPNFESKGLNKERIFSKLFPSDSFQDRKLWDVLSNLSIKLEEFLIINEVKSNPYLKQKLLSQTFRRRNLYSLFVRNSNAFIKKLEKETAKDKETYFKLTELYHSLFFHTNNPKFRTSEENLPAMMKNLDLFYSLSKMHYSCELIARGKYLNQDYEIKLLDEVPQVVENSMLKEHPLFSIYLNMTKMFLNGDDDEYYVKVKDIFLKETKKIKKNEQQTILVFLLNHAIRMTNKGNYEYHKDILVLYKYGLKSELLIEHGRIGDENFTNIAVIGAFQKDLDWTKKFIKKYSNFLDSSNKENAIKLSWGYWHFYNASSSGSPKDFEQTIKLLQELDFNQITYGLRARSLLLRTYYEFYLRKTEHDNFQFIQYFALAFEKYIKRNKTLSPSKRKEYLNLISIVKKMTVIKYKIFYKIEKVNFKMIKSLNKILKEMGHSTTRHWIEEKIVILNQLFIDSKEQ